MRKKMLVVVGIIIALAAIGRVAWFLSYELPETLAESRFDDYLNEMFKGAEVLGSHCPRRDSNANGYISCSARVREEGQCTSERMLAIECDSTITGGGCKPQQNVCTVAQAPMPSSR